MARRESRLVPVAARGEGADLISWMAESQGLPGQALGAPGPVSETAGPGNDWLPLGHRLPGRIAVAIPGGQGVSWGVLATADDSPPASLGELETFLVAVARQLGVAIHADRLRRRPATSSTGPRPLGGSPPTSAASSSSSDPVEVSTTPSALRGRKAAVSSQARREVTERWPRTSRTVPGCLRDLRSRRCREAAADAVRSSPRYRDDPRAVDVRSAVVQEGFDTICAAPLSDGDELLGLLIVYHDRPHEWTDEELATLAGFAAQAATALKNAQNYERMATWAAHLQSIQQLGARLARLTTEKEIGAAIANELDQLIKYHNVGLPVCATTTGRTGRHARSRRRVPRRDAGQSCASGSAEGITGWVARNRVSQYLPDAANDPRAVTIPGSEGRPRGVEAPGAIDLRGRRPRGHRPLQARPSPVHRRRTCGST